MKHQLLLTVLLIPVCLTDIQFNLKQYGNNTFTVSISNTLIIEHSPHKPFLYVGNGKTHFKETSGNFEVTDYVDERLGLPNYRITNDSSSFNITMYLNTVQVAIRLGSEENHPLTIDIGDLGQYDRIWIRLHADEAESVFGGGEQYSYLNLRGKTFPIWAREQGIGRNRSNIVTFVTDLKHAGGDYYTSYFTQPTFVSTNLYYFHHGGSNYAILDFRHSDFHEVLVTGQPERMYINTGETYKDLVYKLTGFLGRMPPLPDWIYDGAIIGVHGGSEKMLNYINYCFNYSIPITGVWIQDWSGYVSTDFGKRVYWNWHWNQTLYPGLDKIIVDLKAKNIRVMGYVNPYLTTDGELFKVADQYGYLVKNSTNQTYIQDFTGIFAGTIDFTNPMAYNWYKNKIIKENMIDLGLGGWMADFSEYLPIDANLYNKQLASSVHNLWPVFWAKLNREAVEESSKLGDVVFFTRAGFSGTGKYTTLMWAGDQNVDFSYADGIASTIPAALSMGLSGVGITHFDIGGYTTFSPILVRGEELLLRSAEYAAFGPVFRTHEGNQPGANVQFYSTDKISTRFSRLAKIFKSLKPYTKYAVNKTVTRGIPVYRPLFMNYPSDVGSYNNTYQFMFGDDLLIAPVYRDFRESWTVYLPVDPGASWIHLWTGDAYRGPQTINVFAPLGKPPVFYRSNSIFKKLFKKISKL